MPGGQVAGRDAVGRFAALCRAGGLRVVLTNGCFDVLHRGHVDYLAGARALGDVLIVGLNSDDGVRHRKGPGRPVNTAADRAAVLAALRCVSYVTEFGEDTAAELVAATRPHVYVKGGDYREESLPEAAVARQFGARVVILPFVPGHSTTATLDRLSTAVTRHPD
jgi:rfaE bifunctional protein nucleotidyltransferase chain/domain